MNIPEHPVRRFMRSARKAGYNPSCIKVDLNQYKDLLSIQLSDIDFEDYLTEVRKYAQSEEEVRKIIEWILFELEM